ncbi:spore coat protein GerQ [Mesobacillus subterraneus]|uniref:spore coat protein GerQ n=1 Tax=Mesobacillus subterraneus TaxID=285983 RepID=UPI001CFCD48B|nr:spore coat protein GerQ [Mesobacillus subterraneus]WLR55252.1 spore coat protein GerQ [Mesobacillus subterraneus]
MTEYNNPYYNYRTYPQMYQPYSGTEDQTAAQGKMGQMGQMAQMGQMGQAGFPQGTAFPAQSGGAMPGVSVAGAAFQGVSPQVPGMLPIEASYIENILRLNKGKLATVYATFENNTEWNAKIFQGIVEAAGRDHLILSDPQTGKRVLLPMIYLDYVTFDEEIEYDYPFGGGGGLTAYPPR